MLKIRIDLCAIEKTKIFHAARAKSHKKGRQISLCKFPKVYIEEMGVYLTNFC